MIKDELVTYEVAKLAREKGFNEGCLYHYSTNSELHANYNYNCDGVGLSDLRYDNDTLWYPNSEVVAPSQSLLQRWLREEKGYYVYPFFDNDSERWTWVCRERTGNMWIPLVDFEVRHFATYEPALEDGLKYVLDNLV